MRIRLFLLALGVATTGACTRTADNSAWALTNVSVVDVANSRIEARQTVQIYGDRIIAVGPTDTLSISAEVRRRDASGTFVVPGLFDMHTHVLGPEGTRWWPPLNRYVEAGVLGVRDLGSPLDAIGATASSETPIRPTIWFSGPVLDLPRAGGPGIFLFVQGDDQARDAVLTLARAGVQFIKVHDWLTRSMYLAIVDAARKQGLPVVGHVPVSVGIDDAARAGQKSIEHLGGTHAVLRTCAPVDPRLDEQVVKLGSDTDKGPAYRLVMSDAYLTPLLDSFDTTMCVALADRLARAKVWQVPTLVLWRSWADSATSPDVKAVPRETVRDLPAHC